MRRKGLWRLVMACWACCWIEDRNILRQWRIRAIRILSVYSIASKYRFKGISLSHSPSLTERSCKSSFSYQSRGASVARAYATSFPHHAATSIGQKRSLMIAEIHYIALWNIYLVEPLNYTPSSLYILYIAAESMLRPQDAEFSMR